MRIAILQLAATVAVATYAGFAVLSGLDRLAEADGPLGNAAFPAVTGWAYARNAPNQAALVAARNRQSGLAQALMRQALVADPVSERMIGNLGLVRLEGGDAAGANAAFQVSAQRGWRDPITHIYWMKQSLEAGDFTAAALQADALLHEPFSSVQSDPIVNTLLEYDEGRAALAARLRNKPPWSRAFATDFGGETSQSLAARADVIGRAGPGIWTCQDAAGLTDQVLAAGFLSEARAAHDATCAQSAGKSANLLNDARFVRYRADGRASQFDWLAPDSTDVTIAPAQQGHQSTGVEIAATRGVTMQVLTQRVVAAPGTYRLAWRMPGSDAQSARALAVGLDCQSDLARAGAGSAVPGTPDTYAITIRFAGDCPAPILSFWLRPIRTAVTLDDVTLERDR